MPAAGPQLSAGCGLPDLHGPVLPRRGEALAVGAERHAEDALPVPLESEDLLASGRVPNLRFPVGWLPFPAVAGARGGQAPAIGAEYHALHRAGVGFPVQGFLVALHVPDPYPPV